MEDIHKVGGTPALLKYLMAQGFIDGSCLTVTGETHQGGGVPWHCMAGEVYRLHSLMYGG